MRRVDLTVEDADGRPFLPPLLRQLETAGFKPGDRVVVTAAEDVERLERLAGPKTISLAEQVDRLADWIMANVPGEPSRSEGAIQCAIRLLGEQHQRGAADREREIVAFLEDVATGCTNGREYEWTRHLARIIGRGDARPGKEQGK